MGYFIWNYTSGTIGAFCTCLAFLMDLPVSFLLSCSALLGFLVLFMLIDVDKTSELETYQTSLKNENEQILSPNTRF